jgi:hypothetical protein
VTRLGGLWSSLVAVKRRPTPQQIVAAEAETSSGAFKKGIIIGALGLFQPTFALKLIIATEIFLDAGLEGFSEQFCRCEVFSPGAAEFHDNADSKI